MLKIQGLQQQIEQGSHLQSHGPGSLKKQWSKGRETKWWELGYNERCLKLMLSSWTFFHMHSERVNSSRLVLLLSKGKEVSRNASSFLTCSYSDSVFFAVSSLSRSTLSKIARLFHARSKGFLRVALGERNHWIEWRVLFLLFFLFLLGVINDYRVLDSSLN